MNTPTYQEQREKIIDAYFRDEIEPYDREFCFCGTLGAQVEDNHVRWDRLIYSGEEYQRMEYALLVTISEEMKRHIPLMANNIFCESRPPLNYGELRKELFTHPAYEDALFTGMVAALEVLRQIHIERGENVEEEIPFVKRHIALIK